MLASVRQLLFFPFGYRLPFTVCYRLPLVTVCLILLLPCTVYRLSPLTVAYRSHTQNERNEINCALVVSWGFANAFGL